MNVQHWIADEPLSSDASATHETVICKACTGIHFIDRKSGALLGATTPSRPPSRSPKEHLE